VAVAAAGGAQQLGGRGFGREEGLDRELRDGDVDRRAEGGDGADERQLVVAVAHAQGVAIPVASALIAGARPPAG